MSLTLLYKTTAVVLLLLLFLACNTSHKENATERRPGYTDSVKSAKAQAIDPKIQSLLTHFKEVAKFPVIVDSAFIANIDKHDSLGANEVETLAKEWFYDSLVFDSRDEVKTFYTIDSVKAKHTFAAWADKLDVGSIEYANAYGLEKVLLNDSTSLLVWALNYISYPADPNYSGTDIYFTMLNRNTIGQTFMLGGNSLGADPPSVGQTDITGKLTEDGKLVMDERILNEDIDSLKGIVDHTHYEYHVQYNLIKQLVKERDAGKPFTFKESN